MSKEIAYKVPANRDGKIKYITAFGREFSYMIDGREFKLAIQRPWNSENDMFSGSGDYDRIIHLRSGFKMLDGLAKRHLARCVATGDTELDPVATAKLMLDELVKRVGSAKIYTALDCSSVINDAYVGY